MHNEEVIPLDSHEMADLVAFLIAYRYYLTELGQPGNPQAGKRVFEAKGCSACHGDRSALNKPGPSLERYRGRFSAVYLAQTMWNHGPEMAEVMRRRGVPWPKFVGSEMGDLIAYLQAETAATPDQRVYFEPGSPLRGCDLFTVKQCSACHAIAGVGGSGGPVLGRRWRELVGSVSEIAGLMWNHSQSMAAERERRWLGRVTFAGQEMADIIAYLYFVNYANVTGTPARGAALFEQADSKRRDRRGCRPDMVGRAAIRPRNRRTSCGDYTPEIARPLPASGFLFGMIRDA